MKAPIKVVSEEEYQKWIKPRQEKNAGAPAPAAPPSPSKAASLTDQTSKNTL